MTNRMLCAINTYLAVLTVMTAATTTSAMVALLAILAGLCNCMLAVRCLDRAGKEWE